MGRPCARAASWPSNKTKRRTAPQKAAATDQSADILVSSCDSLTDPLTLLVCIVFFLQMRLPRCALHPLLSLPCTMHARPTVLCSKHKTCRLLTRRAHSGTGVQWPFSGGAVYMCRSCVHVQELFTWVCRGALCSSPPGDSGKGVAGRVQMRIPGEGKWGVARCTACMCNRCMSMGVWGVGAKYCGCGTCFNVRRSNCYFTTARCCARFAHCRTHQCSPLYSLCVTFFQAGGNS